MVIIENSRRKPCENVQNADFAQIEYFSGVKLLTSRERYNIIVYCIIMEFCTFSFAFTGKNELSRPRRKADLQ